MYSCPLSNEVHSLINLIHAGQASGRFSQMMGAAQGRRRPNHVGQHRPAQVPSVAGVEMRFLAALEARHEHLKQVRQRGRVRLHFFLLLPAARDMVRLDTVIGLGM